MKFTEKLPRGAGGGAVVAVSDMAIQPLDDDQAHQAAVRAVRRTGAIIGLRLDGKAAALRQVRLRACGARDDLKSCNPNILQYEFHVKHCLKTHRQGPAMPPDRCPAHI
ncbi:hypothetical protein [Maritimibacter fusiformis]|uniref:Uncharacterized protein n=1 Tax=Maritimibacter fusiformis TaxID=2603819 RepID=A0A5D0RKV9_9RHOB|nr:hypothetical protein [Maritimibacter fusiformis]TYB81415.1 hypothetical protein FVF75_09925 [Maritimibacter fusiformis]